MEHIMPDKWRILAARHQLSLVPRLPPLTRHPDHLDAEVCGELAQVALLGHLAVLGVGDEVGGHGVLINAANRLIGEVVQSRRRPLLGPSPG